MQAKFLRISFGLVVGLMLWSGLILAETGDNQARFVEALTKLGGASMQERGAAIEALAAVQEPRAIVVLQALLDGRLLKLKADNRLVIGTEINAGYQLLDAQNGQDLGIMAKDLTQKITVNNSLRVALRKTLGRLELNASEPSVRIKAVQAMSQVVDAETLVLLQARLKTEADAGVQDAIKLVLGLEQLNSHDKAARMDAIDLLKEHPNKAVVNRLNALQEKDAEGVFVETDADVRNQAKAALVNINAKLQVYAAVETLFFGLSLGAVLVLAAIGLAITFGVMGVINMAHGELMMLGAYTTYVMQQLLPDALGWALVLSIPAAFIIAGLVGIAIERGIIRFLYGRPLETLLATFGVSLVLQQAVRSIFSL